MARRRERYREHRSEGIRPETTEERKARLGGCRERTLQVKVPDLKQGDARLATTMEERKARLATCRER